MDKEIEASLKRLKSTVEIWLSRFEQQSREMQRLEARFQQSEAEVARLRKMLDQKQRHG